MHQAPVNIWRKFFEEWGGDECEANGRDVNRDHGKKFRDSFLHRVKILK